MKKNTEEILQIKRGCLMGLEERKTLRKLGGVKDTFFGLVLLRPEEKGR